MISENKLSVIFLPLILGVIVLAIGFGVWRIYLADEDGPAASQSVSNADQTTRPNVSMLDENVYGNRAAYHRALACAWAQNRDSESVSAACDSQPQEPVIDQINQGPNTRT